MTLQWTVITFVLCTVVLCAEIATLLILLLLWIRPAMRKRVFNSRIMHRLKKFSNVYAYAFIFVLLLLFADASHEVYKYYSHIDVNHETPGLADTELLVIQKRLLRAQQNLCISVVSLLLALVIRQIVQLLSRCSHLEPKKSTLTGDNQCNTELPVKRPLLTLAPPEVWMEVLGFLKRRELAELIDKLPGDRHFSWITQTLLHEYGRIRLSDLSYFDSSLSVTDSEGGTWDNMPIPIGPMPDNIVDFTRIFIDQIDWKLLDFLRVVQCLLNNINLQISVYDPLDDQHGSDDVNVYVNVRQFDYARPALIRLLSLFSGINSISNYYTYNVRSFCQFLPLFRDNFPSALFGARLIHLDISNWVVMAESFSLEETVADLLVDWLCTPRIDEKPRILVIGPLESNDIFMLWQKIHERFVTASGPPAPFFFRTPTTIEEKIVVFENEVTGELLTLRNGEHEYEVDRENWQIPLKLKEKKTSQYTLVTRCASGVNKCWLEAEEGRILGWQEEKDRQIELAEAKIGQIFPDNAVVRCHICEAKIPLAGQAFQFVVKCQQCSEMTPINVAPPGQKYVHCPCHCLIMCKVSTNCIACPRCKRMIATMQNP